MFVLNSDIAIGNLRFSGVNEVRVKRSMHSVLDTAIIRIPSRGMIRKGKMRADGTIEVLTGTANKKVMGNVIQDGHKITIRLGYNGDLRTEFEGFVRRRVLGRPLEIECEGYARQLRLNIHLNGFLKETTVKECLELACGLRDPKSPKQLLAKPLTDIKVVCEVDVPLVNIRMIAGANGLQMIDELKRLTQGALSVFFINPTTLWCGLTYTPYTGSIDPFGLGSVAYRLGYNCIKDNGLKERVVNEPVQVILKGKLATGQVVQGKSDADYAAYKADVICSNIPNEGMIRQIAQEVQLRRNYEGYEGRLCGFLQPFCLPGYQATVEDPDYVERNGIYMVEGTEVLYGMSGARRFVELGPRIGFKSK